MELPLHIIIAVLAFVFVTVASYAQSNDISVRQHVEITAYCTAAYATMATVSKRAADVTSGQRSQEFARMSLNYIRKGAALVGLFHQVLKPKAVGEGVAATEAEAYFDYHLNDNLRILTDLVANGSVEETGNLLNKAEVICDAYAISMMGTPKTSPLDPKNGPA
jgi:hypothetical protein